MDSDTTTGLRRTAYLAGPMRGYEDYNFPAFKKAAELLRKVGWIIFSPAERDEDDAEALRVMEEARAAGDWHIANPLAYYMQFDLPLVCKSDAVILLPGWEESQGARLEAQTALSVGINVWEYDPFRPDGIGSPVREIPPLKTGLTLPLDSTERKNVPLLTGVLDYFPAALREIAKVSKFGNDKHNPGEPLHWARGKSMDQGDAVVRHLVERGQIDPESGLRQSAQMAWRALALLQLELEEAGEAPLARGASA